MDRTHRWIVALGTVAACRASGDASPTDAGTLATTDAASTTTATPPTTTTADTTSERDATTSASTGDGTGSTGTTGPGAPPMLTVDRITDQNRAYVEMHGGWGPHLRAPMQSTDGTLWFAYDGGPDVTNNTTILYARRDDAGWQTVATQPHAAGVQQNSAHVMSGDLVRTYSVNPIASVLEECYFDTTDYAYAACNSIQIGGSYSTPPSSNYVGAAIGPGGERIVWFTVVGAAGGTGQLVYTYDYGGGFNGPVVTTLPGYNDFAYVRAFFRAPSTMALVGQAYVGPYPNGQYATGVAEVAFGDPVDLHSLSPAPADGQVHSGRDVWIDPDTGDTHAMARVGGDVAYYVLPFGAAWVDHLDPVAWLTDTVHARWLQAPGGPLVLVTSGGAGVRVGWAEAGGVVDWDTAETIDVAIPSDGFEQPSAIYAAGPEYQTVPISGLHFAVCGEYGIGDAEIWHVAVELP